MATTKQPIFAFNEFGNWRLVAGIVGGNKPGSRFHQVIFMHRQRKVETFLRNNSCEISVIYRVGSESGNF